MSARSSRMPHRWPASSGWSWRCWSFSVRCAIIRARDTSVIVDADCRFWEPTMTEQHDLPTPPQLPGLEWRPLRPTDQEAITALSADCQTADGGQALVAANRYLREE